MKINLWSSSFSRILPKVGKSVIGLLLPESPRWLIARGKTEDALKILSEAAKTNGISGINLKEKVAELKESTDDDPARVSVLQLFRPELRLRTLTLWYIWSATSFVYFGISYNTNELSGDAFVNFTAYALIEIPACVLAQTVIQYRGRRAPLTISMACAGATSLLVHLIPEEFEWLRTSVPLFGKFCITATFSILGLFTSEVFPTVLRSIGYGSASAISSFAAILAPFVCELFRKIKDFAEEFNLKSTIKLQRFDRYAHHQKSKFFMDNKQSHNYNTEHSPAVSSHIF
ncbi:Solute carrier family 22 member 21 [Araneus ventricosus]|uniref:Solute carrier family 22 member 21 n=1 Tax=Araneus ventricosus TaxID=182803 RepID=A0A4Y2TI88_ARAVE|nr:Solute carrier family 22 member 21 [Araneus ventricosus]